MKKKKKAQIIKNVSHCFAKFMKFLLTQSLTKLGDFFKGVKRRSLCWLLFTLFLELSMFTNKTWSSLINLEM